MNNHTINLEGRCGRIIWTLPDDFSKCLDKYDDNKIQQYLNLYGHFLSNAIRLLSSIMLLQLEPQGKFLDLFENTMVFISKEVIKELKSNEKK